MTQLDTKYLKKINGSWYLRIRLPKSWGSDKIFIKSLKTQDISLARRIRDKYLLPVLVEHEALEALKSIAQVIMSLNPSLESKVKHLNELFTEDSSNHTISGLFDQYLNFQEKGEYRKGTFDSYIASKNAFIKLLGDQTVNLLEKSHIILFRDKAAKLPCGWQQMSHISLQPNSKLLSPTTLNNYLARFRTVWRWAIEEGLINKECPAKGIKAPYISQNKFEERISIEECNQLMNIPYTGTKGVGEDEWYYLPRIARYTGMRLAEVCQLRGEDFERVQGFNCICVRHKVKTVTSYRNIPISDKLEEIISPLRQIKGPLFKNVGTEHNKIGNAYSRAFGRKAKKVGGHCKFHGLRAYAITEMANAGVPEIDRKRITGHKDSSVHSSYTRSDMKRLKDAVDKIP